MTLDKNFDDPFNYLEKTNHLLLIAVDDYAHHSKLNNCVNDIERLEKVLTEKYEFESAHIKKLVNQQVTKQHIFDTLESYRNLTEDDNLIIWFSGHGTYDKVINTGYWVMQDSLQNRAYYLSTRDLQTELNAISGVHHILLLIDSCFGQAMMPLNTRSDSYATKLYNMKSRWAFASGRLTEVNDGNPEDGNSPFANTFIQQLEEGGEIQNIVSLAEKVSQRVESFTRYEHSPQHPVYSPLGGRYDEGGQFVFFPKILAFKEKAPVQLFTPISSPKKEVLNQKKPLQIPEMVLVEGGTFIMGATAEQGDNVQYDEKPTHQVTLDSFMIGKYAVTNTQFCVFLNNNGYLVKVGEYQGNLTIEPHEWGIEEAHEGFLPQKGHEHHPVINVSWYGAWAYAQWLSAQTGEAYRLPIEAEWEFAARGGRLSRGYKYAGTSTKLAEYAWYNENSNGKPHPVGQKRPNELGLYDMSGNVFEWCNDWYREYTSQTQFNPQGPESGSYRVYRGGSWGNDAQVARVSIRHGNIQDRRSNYLGFRLSKTVTL